MRQATVCLDLEKHLVSVPCVRIGRAVTAVAGNGGGPLGESRRPPTESGRSTHKEVEIPSNRKCRRCQCQRPTPKIARAARARRRIATSRAAARTARMHRRVNRALAECGARHHFRRLLSTAEDELVRIGVKASLSGVGALALYWWHHHS